MNSFKYSEYLKNLNDFERKNAPKQLFTEGDTSLLTEGVRVSVVGSRKPSKFGIQRAKIVVKELVSKNITVVSGLADGIDTIAHQTAIELHGKTIAVVGTDLSKVYPSKNKELFEEIKKSHLAISQFPEGYPMQKKNFPMRNRTMALISDATIIVEASEKSGTKHQGWEALRLGRHLFILQNIIDDKSITWAKEMIKYGAQALTRKDMPELLDEIPNVTSIVNADFTF
ncbi:MAG: DNA-protecting protein DprA [Bacteroidetes bacterium]|nr:DNA-protecting protein DprA [Bacteroidota bacterium]